MTSRATFEDNARAFASPLPSPVFMTARASLFSIERQMGALLGLFSLWGCFHFEASLPVRLSMAVLALLFFLLTAFKPAFYKPIVRVWMAFGHLLEKIMLPVVMLVIFACLFLPVGLLARAFGHDPLHLRPSAQDKTYWLPAETEPVDFDVMY